MRREQFGMVLINIGDRGVVELFAIVSLDVGKSLDAAAIQLRHTAAQRRLSGSWRAEP